MKKLLLIVALIACGCGLKAQTLVKPFDSLLLKAPNFYMNVKPEDNPIMKKYFSVPPIQKATPLIAAIKPVTAVPFASRMPIAKVTSDDKMPIAKVSSNDRMPVVTIKPVDPFKPVTP
ncbi:MAG: hypothetical protein ACHQHN_01685 [Sphingobacteriales bacterium]